jgi:hypothetical protein
VRAAWRGYKTAHGPARCGSRGREPPRRAGAALRREGDAVARHDLAGVRRAVARFQPLDYRKSAGFARLGLPACGQL